MSSECMVSGTSQKIVQSFAHNTFEQRAWLDNRYVCGIDEAGRGCLAGPVVCAAAIIPQGVSYHLLKDSKIMSECEREEAYTWIMQNCYYSVAIVSHEIIDSINIYQATLLGMKKALMQLLDTAHSFSIEVKYVLIDAMPLNVPKVYQNNVMQVHHFNYGESLSSSIAAASIVAKVTRDRLIKKTHRLYPHFDFNKHKGYGTKTHRKVLIEHGATLLHRKSFLSKIIGEKNNNGKQGKLF